MPEDFDKLDNMDLPEDANDDQDESGAGEDMLFDLPEENLGADPEGDFAEFAQIPSEDEVPWTVDAEGEASFEEQDEIAFDAMPAEEGEYVAFDAMVAEEDQVAFGEITEEGDSFPAEEVPLDPALGAIGDDAVADPLDISDMFSGGAGEAEDAVDALVDEEEEPVEVAQGQSLLAFLSIVVVLGWSDLRVWAVFSTPRINCSWY